SHENHRAPARSPATDGSKVRHRRPGYEMVLALFGSFFSLPTLQEFQRAILHHADLRGDVFVILDAQFRRGRLLKLQAVLEFAGWRLLDLAQAHDLNPIQG